MRGKIADKLERLVEENLQDSQLSISDLCRRIGVSRAHLHRKLKSETGLSTSHFIRKVRLRHARQLLLRSDLNISEIAYKTGHSSPQNFSKYFSAEYGTTPTLFRKEEEKRPTSTFQGNNKQKKIKRFLTAPSFVIVLGISLSLFLIMMGNGSLQSDPDDFKPAIAILPFEPMGEEDHFLSAGIAEDIMTQLSQFDNLRVINRGSSDPVDPKKPSLQQISSQLKVAYILQGNVRRHEDRVKINAHLVNVKDGQTLWAESYDRTIDNVIDIQGTVAKEIAEALGHQISPDVEKQMRRVPTEHIEAYNALLKGKHLLKTRLQNNIVESRKYFDQAIEIDPNYSEAYAEKAAAYGLLHNVYYDPQKAAQRLELAEENALLAISKHIRNAYAYALLANVYRDQYRWDQALTTYQIALDINPNSALTNYWYALTLRTVNRLEESKHYHRMACELDPLYPVINAGYIYTCLLANDFDEADHLIAESSILFEGSFLHRLVQGFAHLCKGQFTLAIPYYDQCLQLNPDFDMAKTQRAYCKAKLGLIKPDQVYPVPFDFLSADDYIDAGQVFMGLGEVDSCISLFTKAAEMGRIPGDVLVHPSCRGLRHHPQFIQLLKDYDLYRFVRESSL